MLCLEPIKIYTKPVINSAKDIWLKHLLKPTTPISFHGHRRLHFPADWSIGPNSIKNHAIHFVSQGSISGTIESEPISIKPGGLFWIVPGTKRNLSISNHSVPTRGYWIRFSVRSKQPLKHNTILEDASSLLPIFTFLIGQLEDPQSKSPFATHTQRGSLVALLSSILNRHETQDSKLRTLSPAQQQVIREHVEPESSYQIKPQDLAQAVHLSHDYFTRLFTNTYGIPPRVWLKQERIYRAAEYLRETTLSIGEISDALGFQERHLFSRQFSEVMGMSASSFRETLNQVSL